MRKTALYEVHEKLGAKIVEFAGYLMPIQYRGINEEHIRVRKTVGMFDVSHMGQFEFSGDKAEDFLQYLTINDVKSLAVYQAQYNAMCYDNGGIVDDLIIYRFPEKFLMVVNAANIEKDKQWILQHLWNGVKFEDRSDEFSLIAIQGRNAKDALKKLTAVNLGDIKNYWLAEGAVADAAAMIARTGYTGEDGFEVMVANESAVDVWNKLMEAGKPYDIEPVGLGARDTLRMEVKYCLYGNDIDQTTNPLEAGLGWITKLDVAEDFVAKDALQQIKANGVIRKLIAFELLGKAIPRHEYKILNQKEEEVGVVTSGMFSPMLRKPIGLGYVTKDLAKIGTELMVDIRGRRMPMKIVKPPFYERDY
ncbi:MAG: glycine cleavage system aminomethyltransferase GcvT [Calditrichaeota bacterium]|nr:glycine cleavage system aminomethyltransferase GcvT [Calditrichota bacterium]